MSFFFRHIPTAEANFSVQSTAEAAGEDHVLVSPDIWDALCFSVASRRVVVSIKSKRQNPTRSPPDHVSDLICWAIHDPTVSEIAIPPAWLVSYPTIFQPLQLGLDGSFKSVILSTVENPTLTEVVLTAKHESAYLAASIHGEVFENWFYGSHVIIRNGEDVFVPSSTFSTCEPSIQPPSSLFGYTVSLALPHKQGIAQRGSTRFIVTSSDQLGEVTNKAENRVRNVNLEINESFLISALLSSPESSSQANGNGAMFSAKGLQSPIDADLDHFTIYIRTSNLRPLGVLNGDWVLASPIGSSTSRLVRIGALDEAFNDLCPRSAMLSPTLLHNLCSRDHPQIVIRMSPYGTRDPGIPTARSIELARVASPFSIHRCHEALLIDALHEYFRSSKRLVKGGDIIPLRINVDSSLDPRHALCSGDFTGSFRHNRSDVPVYFVVRSVDYVPLTVQTHGLPFPSQEVGCFVDSTLTRIIQVGVEYVRVPDVYDYYQLGHAWVAGPASVGLSHQISQLSNAMSLDEATSLGVRSTVFITGSRGTGKFSAAMHIARLLQMHYVEINCFDVLSDAISKTEVLLQEQVEIALSCSPCLVVLRHVDALSYVATAVDDKEGPSILQRLQQCIDDANQTHGQQCVLLGIVEQGKIPQSMSFSNELEVKALSEEERFHMLLEQVDSQGVPLASDVSVAALAKQSAALVASDLANVIRKAYLCAMLSFDMEQLVIQPVVSAKQFNTALLKARTTFAQIIGAPSIPTVLWEDVGGLGQVRGEILDTVQFPLDHPELFQAGLKKRSGVLLYGPPGTGKTLLAKAVATSCSLNFLSVKGPELLNMYIGESEANVRKVFQRAREANPCVIFFDELDSIAPKRGNQGDSGGVMDRIVSQLLAELDGMSIGGMDIFVIGATNRPDLLDPALLRPGRFDKMLYLGVCQTHEAQLDILKALTRKFNLHPSLKLSSIVAQCPFNYTGADFYALCADALLHALSHKVAELEKERAQLNASSKYQQHPISPQFFIADMKSDADLQLVVRAEDFNLALEELIPSVSNSELLHYASIQKNWHD
ncbi:P-loop containing nucleoside triphosphate hydrolase protein [Boletus edulis BED1]|uniref:Peroxisomal ATPase PEX6 n=1 Tax=Boletus edulis BED1 TaxID=1328754 RepID=A0AAD4BEE9_BOLED|nr:P-loop containing nucleoside triphosphate hydrolase protein [Boletus edulis BED1]